MGELGVGGYVKFTGLANGVKKIKMKFLVV